MVGISFARYFNTNGVAKLGNVAKLPLCMTLSHILFAEKKYIVCKNLSSSCFEYIISRTTDAVLVIVVRFNT